MKMALTEKQERFCEKYLGEAKFSVTEAYLMAGYKCSRKSAAQSGARLLTRPDIQAYLNELRSHTSEKVGIDRAKVMELIRDRAFADMADAAEWDARSLTLKDSKDLPASVTRSIQSIRFTKGEEGELLPSITMKQDSAAVKILSDFYGLTQPWHQIMEGLKRFGIALVPDDKNPTGWSTAIHEEA